MERVARQTVGFSGADLANLVNEAAILAARRTKNLIALSEFTEAIDRVLLGPARKSRAITDKEKEITAYHEAGHAVVAHVLPDADNPFKVTIVSRGQSGGHTRYLPEEEDRNLWDPRPVLRHARRRARRARRRGVGVRPAHHRSRQRH